MTKKPKIATLVISSDTYPATRNSKAQKKIFFKEGFEKNLTFWYKGNNSNKNRIDTYQISDNNLIIETSDATINMGLKTILALEWLEKYIDYEYIVRPTPSSYINYENLNNFIIQNLSKEEYVYCGNIQSTNNKYGEKINFVSGSTLILNKNTVKQIINNKDKWDHEYWDDVALSILMKELNIEPQSSKRYDVEGNPFKNNISLDFYQYRCRCDNHYGYPRFLESISMTVVHKILFLKKISMFEKLITNILFELSKLLYIYQFGWKTYSLLRNIAKYLLPKKIYIFIKNRFEKKIEHFKNVRFKF